MGESKKHRLLKEQARTILLEKGFDKKEIYDEYRFEHFLIDCVGIKKDLKVAIECGNLSQKNKLKLLRRKFDIVIYIPYLPIKKKYKRDPNMIMVPVPKKIKEELRKLRLWPQEPYYHIIGRLIVEHKEKEAKGKC